MNLTFVCLLTISRLRINKKSAYRATLEKKYVAFAWINTLTQCYFHVATARYALGVVKRCWQREPATCVEMYYAK
jgi:hypothetical protein